MTFVFIVLYCDTMKTLPPKFYIRIPSEEVFRKVEKQLFDAGYKWFCEPRGRQSCTANTSNMILAGSWNDFPEFDASKKEIRSIGIRTPQSYKDMSLADFVQLDQDLERYEVGPKGGIAVRFTPELMGLVETIVRAKNLKCDINPRLPFIYLNSLGELSTEGSGREVDVWEFLKELQAIPEIEKIFQLHLKEFEAVLTKEKITVGCQTFTADQFKEIKTAAEAYSKTIRIPLGDDRVALIFREGLAISGAGNITWEDFDAIIEEANKL